MQFTPLPRWAPETFAVLDLAGHNLPFEQPQLFGTVVGEWLDGVAAR